MSESVFGDDINSTPVSKLQPAMHSKKNDAPLDVPVYNPDPPVEEKKVRFEEPPQQRPIPKKRPPPKRPPPRRPPPQRQFREPPTRQYREPPMYYDPPPVVENPPPVETKMSALSRVINSYGKHAVVFFMIVLCLYMYPKIASIPYFGNTIRMSWIGILITASGAAGINAMTSTVL